MTVPQSTPSDDDELLVERLEPRLEHPVRVEQERHAHLRVRHGDLQDVERRLHQANRLAACLHDPRQPGRSVCGIP